MHIDPRKLEEVIFFFQVHRETTDDLSKPSRIDEFFETAEEAYNIVERNLAGSAEMLRLERLRTLLDNYRAGTVQEFAKSDYDELAHMCTLAQRILYGPDSN